MSATKVIYKNLCTARHVVAVTRLTQYGERRHELRKLKAENGEF
jgi:hypothetical protein